MSKIFDNIETKFEEGLHAIPGSGDRTWLFTVGNMSLMSPKKASELMVNCAEFEYKVESDQIAAVAEKAVAELRDKLDSEYKSAAAASFPDEDIFMSIADDIGFDAIGKSTKVNELDEIGAELAKFINTADEEEAGR